MSDEIVDIDALLDGTLDDLADVPEFKNYPAGVHKVKISWDLAKEVSDGKGGKKKVVGLNMTGIETVELPAGSEDAPITEGQVANVMFDLKNEYGQGQFKEIMKSLAAHYGAKSNRELAKESEGAEVLVTTDLRDNKDKTKKFLQVVALAVC